jgi:branched-chain amino acid transport system ATP-binding protein
VAVDDISTDIELSEIRAIIGPNGAGKTTLLNMMSGFYTVTAGSITFQGKEMTRKTTYNIAKCGFARTYQNIRLFKKLTVEENILIGMHMNLKQITFDSLFFTKRFRTEEKKAREEVEKHLEMVNLGGIKNITVENLAYGQMKVLEIARCLAMQPKVLLLDEPAAGLNQSETNDLCDLINDIRDMGITIILIEHNMSMVMRLADKITVMNFGKKLAEGTASEISNNPEVIAAYLGKGGE